MKHYKTIAALFASAILVCSLSGCGEKEDRTIVVGASQTPHSEILQTVKEDLAAEGWTLKIEVFDDYILPNTALENGELDANYFQHTPYLNTFNADYGTNLVSVDKIHYEPFAVYGKNVTDYAENKTGRTILVPNDGSNLARALFVLRDEGFLTLKDGVSASESLTVLDISDSKGNTVKPILAEAVSAQLSESEDGTLAVINGNYALQAGLDVKDALAVEDASGDAAQEYANIIAVRRGNETSEKTSALLKALKTQKVYDFITNTYHGAVLPVFTV